MISALDAVVVMTHSYEQDRELLARGVASVAEVSGVAGGSASEQSLLIRARRRR